MPCLKMFHGFNHIPNETTVVEALNSLVPLLPTACRFMFHAAHTESSEFLKRVWSLSGYMPVICVLLFLPSGLFFPSF